MPIKEWNIKIRYVNGKLGNVIKRAPLKLIQIFLTQRREFLLNLRQRKLLLA